MGFSCEFCENFLIQFAIEIISLYNNHGREPKEEIMTQKHKALSSSLTIVTLLTCFTTAALTSPIRAEGESEADVKPTIRLEINDLNAADKIKTALFQEAAVSVPAEATTLMAPAADLTNAEIKIDQLDLSKLGPQDVMVHLTLNNSAAQNSLQTTLSREVTLDIQDTTAPVIELKYPHIRLEYEEEWNPLDWVETVSDNSLEPLDIQQLWVENYVDASTSGEYEVYFSIADASGNVGSATLGVQVKEKPKPKSSGIVAGDAITSMLNLINNARADAGLDPLSLGDENAQAAIGVRASEAAGYVSHKRPDGSHYKTAFDEYGVSYSHPLEILTYSGSTVQDKFNWWMNSSGHRSIILSSSSTKIAIGYSGKMWAAIAYQ